MAGLDLGDVLHILAGGERVQPATLRRFSKRFARFNLRHTQYGRRMARRGNGVRGDPQAGDPPKIVGFQPEELSAGQAQRSQKQTGTALVSYGVPQSTAGADRRYATPGSSVRPERSGRSGCTATTWRSAIGRTSN